MPTISVSAENFSLVDRWADGAYPQTRSKTVTFEFSIPSGAVITQSTLSFYAGSPKYGAACSMNGSSIETLSTNTMEVSIDAVASSYSAVFSFKCSNTTKVAGSSSLAIRDIVLAIDYISPVSTFTLDREFLDAGESVTATITSGDVTLSHQYVLSLGEFSKSFPVEVDDSAAFQPTV